MDQALSAFCYFLSPLFREAALVAPSVGEHWIMGLGFFGPKWLNASYCHALSRQQGFFSQKKGS